LGALFGLVAAKLFSEVQRRARYLFSDRFCLFNDAFNSSFFAPAYAAMSATGLITSNTEP
jgi:hypothetical protein